jgi:hypothetical protein
MERVTAIHEAGHVIAHLMTGGQFYAVELEPEDILCLSGVVRNSHAASGAGVFTSLAGPVAQYNATGEHCPWHWNDTTSDARHAEMYARRDGWSGNQRAVRAYLKAEFWRVAERLKAPPLPDAIEAIANELLRCRRLSYPECVRAAAPFGIGPDATRRVVKP